MSRDFFTLLHRFRHADFEHGQDVADDAAHGETQGDAALLDSTLGAHDAAGVILREITDLMGLE